VSACVGLQVCAMRTRVDIPCKRVENYQCQWQVGASLQKEVADLMYSRFKSVSPIKRASKELSTVIARGEQGRVLSGLFVEFHLTKDDQIVAHIHYVATLTGFERRGYGTEVMRQIWNIPMLHSLIADVHDDDNGIADFYLRKGFRRVSDTDVVLKELQLDVSKYTYICTKKCTDQSWSRPDMDCSVEWFDPFLVKSLRNLAGKLEARMHVLPNKWVACDERQLLYSVDRTSSCDLLPALGDEVLLSPLVWLLPNDVRATKTVGTRNGICDTPKPIFLPAETTTLGFDGNDTRVMGSQSLKPTNYSVSHSKKSELSSIAESKETLVTHRRSIKYTKATVSKNKKWERSANGSANVSPPCMKRKINELWDEIRKDIEEYYSMYPPSKSSDDLDSTSYNNTEWEIIY